jgi:signal transduction histidine kinase
MNKRNSILIADDNHTYLRPLFEALEQAGFQVVVVENGLGVLEQLAHSSPDLILLDVKMPQMDGFETLRQIKALPNKADIPVIFMTALDEVSDELKGLSLGAVDYITKPIRIERALARIQTQMALYQLQVALQEKNSELEEYAFTVAHDLKGPLTVMLGYVELMTEYMAEEDNLKGTPLVLYVQALQKSVYNQIRIVDDMLTLSSIQKEKVERVPIHMELVIYQLIGRMALSLQAANAEMSYPQSWPLALGHEGWVEEVWVNYLSNGLKYGGQPPRLELGAAVQEDGFVCFWVQDNGPGLTEEECQKLFHEGIRLHRSRAAGHGLGLSIVKRIVEKLGGTVGVESVLGVGSRFYFTLPAA